LAELLKDLFNKGRVLDIVAVLPVLRHLAKKANYSIDLLEPFVKPYYLKNTPINLIKKSYEKFTGKKNYDLILMMDVLEHFKEPLVILKKTRLFLNKNGYLVIQTPNYQSLMAKICKNWSWWMVTDHKYVFSLKSIKLILKKTGFKIVFLKTYEDFIDFKKNFDGNFSNRFFKILFYLSFLVFT
jgi:SAM-dependent methyltransferase